MVMVMDLLAHPIFKDFRLVSGSNGLYNAVSGTGIFEWESPDDVEKSFQKGEFIVTTLIQARSDALMAEQCIKLLISKGVSAIGIKTVYYNEISDDLKAFSTLHGIPIFLFTDTYFDDIIFHIKTRLTSNTLFLDNSLKAKALIKEDLSLDQVVNLAREINPFFYRNILCCYSSLNDKSIRNKKDISHYYAKCFEANVYDSLDSSNMIFSLIRYERGLLIIYTLKNKPEDMILHFTDFLKRLGVDDKAFLIGISSIKSGLEQLGDAVKECIFANTSCLIDNEPLQVFENIGLDRLLMPICYDKWTNFYYTDLLEKITSFDRTHNYKLMDTLLEYVKSNGDIQLTAKKTFQHGNTIRYRLDKAKKILKIDDNPDSFTQLYVFIRLYQIHRNLDNLI